MLVTVILSVIGLQLLLVTAWLILHRPQRGVLLLAILAPFDGLLALVPHPGLLDGWKEALVLALLLATFAAPVPARGLPGRSWPPWVVPLLGFLAVGLASALVVQGTQAVVGLKLNFFYALLLIVVYRCPFSWEERDRFVTILMIVGGVTAAIGLLQQVVGGEALARLGYEYNETIRTAGGMLRSFSTFNQPFPFGFYIMLVLLIGLPVAAANPTRLRNTVFLACVPMFLLAMLSSIVRAALMGFLVGAFFLWTHRYRGLAHLVPPALACLLLIPLDVYKTLLSSTSLGQRSAGWSQTLDRVVAAPLGNGIGSTGSAAEKTAALSGTSSAVYQPDNYYFKTVYELGPLGLWMFVLLLGGVFAYARSRSRQLHDVAADGGRPASGSGPGTRTAQDAALAAGTAASVLAAAVASVVATYFEIFPIDLYFWLLLGVLTSLTPVSSSVPSPSDPTEAGSRPTSASSSED